ncbi:hypothetical protein ACI0X9_003316 [Cronobacter turicensis]
MNSFASILTTLNIADRKPSLGQVRTDVISWGKSNRSTRQRVRITLWLDSEDRNDRIVLDIDVVLNNKKTAPEKGVDICLDIRHFSDFDPVKRKLLTSHPEQYHRIDGVANPEDVKNLYASFVEQINLLVPNESFYVPCIREFVQAA